MAPALFGCGGAIERAVATSGAARLRPQQQIDHLQTQIDTVPVAIITLDDGGEVTLAKHAQRFAGRAMSRVEHLGEICGAAAERLTQPAPGQRAAANEPVGAVFTLSIPTG